MPADRIAVIGAGAWGIALANVIARAGRATTLWGRDAAVAHAIQERRESPRLPGITIDPRIRIAALPAATLDADAVLLAVPAQAVRQVASALASALAPRTP